MRPDRDTFLSLLSRPACELLLHIAPQLSNSIRAALPAVLHLLDDLAKLLLDLSLLLWRWGLDMSELVLRNERHDIMNIYSHGFDLMSNIEYMFVIDPRDDDSIDLDYLLPPHRFLNSLKLLIA